jgi:hypothetical protein
MVVGPPGQVGNLLVTDGTEPVLRLPQMQELSTPLKVGGHLHAEALFEVPLPHGIVGIGGCLYLGMALNGHGGGFVEILLLSLAVGGEACAMKYPMAIALRRKVFLCNPASQYR